MKKLDNLLAWKVFKLALETGNLTQASIQLDLDTAAASRLIDGLERELVKSFCIETDAPSSPQLRAMRFSLTSLVSLKPMTN